MARTDYSKELSDIAAPVSPDGGLLVRAGQVRGAAEESSRTLAGQAKATNIKLAAGITETLVKGKMEADVEKEAKETISNLSVPGEFEGDAARARREENMPKAQAAVLAANSLSEQVAGQGIMAEELSGSAASAAMEVQAFRTEAKRYLDAAMTGNIGRQEAITRIGASVKKFSAMAPGWAKDFRQIAANLTGISNVDVLGVHNALTKEGSAEKAAAKAREIEMQLMKEYMSEHGLTSFDQVKPEGLRMWHMDKQAKLTVERLDRQRKAVNLAQEGNDDMHDQAASAEMAGAIAGFTSEFLQVAGKQLTAGDAGSAVAAQAAGAQLSAKLEGTWATLETSLRKRMYGDKRWSQQRAEKFIDDARQSFDRFIQGTKNADGYNLFSQMVKASEGQANLLMNNITIAHPFMATLGKFGVAPELVKSYLAAGPQVFRERFGPRIADSIDKLLREPEAFASSFGALATGADTLPALRSRGKNDEANASNMSMRMELDKWLAQGTQLSPNQRVAAANYLANIGMDEQDKVTRDWIGKTLSHPNLKNLLQQLTPEQQANALAPVYNRVDTVLTNTLQGAKDKTAELNKRYGEKMFGITVNPNTGAFVVNIPTPGQLTQAGILKRRNDPNSPPMAAALPGAVVNANVQADVAALQEDARILNTLVNGTMNTIGATGQKVNRDAVVQEVLSAYASEKSVPRNILTPMVVPTAPQASKPLSSIRTERAVVAALKDIPPEHPDPSDLTWIRKEIDNTKDAKLLAILRQEEQRLAKALAVDSSGRPEPK